MAHRYRNIYLRKFCAVFLAKTSIIAEKCRFFLKEISAIYDGATISFNQKVKLNGNRVEQI